MGEVYRGRDTRLGRDVAIKVLPSHVSSDARLRERFQREARAVSKLTHPHVCTLYDIGHENGIDFLVMEYLEGETLAEALSRGPLPLPLVLRYGAEIADALDNAHRHQVVHRDLKPANVFLTRSGAKVLDFGLAKTAAAPFVPDATSPTATLGKSLTEEGAIIGTLQYMAPEQLQGQAADPRSDIFALGTVLYEMATGRPAFAGKSHASVIAAIINDEPPAISTTQPLAPVSLDHVVRRCLAKDPDERFQSARDLEFALREVERGSQELPSAPKRSRRRALLWMGAAAAIVIGAVGGWFFYARHAASTSRGRSIAVLPFSNLGADRSRDHLRLAIPDELTTILSYNATLAVRPFSVSRRVSGDVDPREAAKILKASHVLSGHIRDEGGKLSITVEAIDARQNRLVWRDVVDVDAGDLIAMRRQLSERIEKGLFPLLDAKSPIRERSRPENSAAYALYLKASALSTDPEPNREALQLLEEVVRIDPAYAPAWSALAGRAYYSGRYADGGQAAFDRSEEAARRALELDPDLVSAASRLVVLRAEQGKMAEALRAARVLVERRADSTAAHLALSYALRYVGRLRESAEECELAWAIDQGDRRLRSCALTYMQMGQPDRGLKFVRADAGTDWSAGVESMILARRGQLDDALRKLPPSHPVREPLSLVVRRAPAAEVNAALERFNVWRRQRDPEEYYAAASVFALCGRADLAIDTLRYAVRSDYCTYPAIELDPVFASIHQHPQYPALLESARQCQTRFADL